MSTKTRNKRPAETARAPANREEAERMLARIGQIQRERTLLNTELEEEVAALKGAAEDRARPLAAEQEALERGIQLWAEANRALLTNGGATKTVRLAGGELAWRLRPPSVRVSNLAGVIEVMRNSGFLRFLRQKTELDKEAMLREPTFASQIPGVTISSGGEDFVVTPETVEVVA